MGSNDRIRPTGGFRQKMRNVSDALLLIIFIALIWQTLHGALGGQVLTSPTETMRKIATLFSDPDFSVDLAETGKTFFLALFIAVSGGLAVGIALGTIRVLGEAMEPILVALYSIPKITLYPVILLIFGLSMSAKVTFGALHGIIPIVIFSMSAVRNIRPIFIRAARSLKLSKWQTVLHVLLPAALPEILSGIRLGFSLTLLGSMLGEMFASRHGIGHMLMFAMERNDIDTIMALAVLLFSFATVANLGLIALKRSDKMAF